MRKLIAGVAVAVALVASSCSTSSSGDVDIPSGLKASIDAYAAEGDCFGLQATFDTVEGANYENRGDIMSYIDHKMDEAGCYD